MKSVKCLLVALCVAQAGWAGVQLGADLRWNLNPQIRTSDPNNTTLETSTTTGALLRVQPYIGIRAGELVEISPYVIYQLSTSSSKTKQEGASENTTSWSQSSVGLGVGVFFHVLRGTLADLSVGPQLSGIWNFRPSQSVNGDAQDSEYSKYYSSTERISVPVNVDFHLSPRVGLRMGMAVLGVTYTTHSYEFNDARDPDVEHDFNFDVQSWWSPSVGLFFRIGG